MAERLEDTRSDGKKLVPYMDAEQRQLKGKVSGLFGSIVQKLLRGILVSHDLKINKVTGVWDPTLFSILRMMEVARQRGMTTERVDETGARRKLHSLARHTLARGKEKHREFAIRSSHDIQFFGAHTENEMRRWDRVADTLHLLEATRLTRA